jgi:stage II sporulation protein R
MKFITTYSILLLACFVLIGVLPSNVEEQIYGKTVRLHVLANSDSEEDQAVKYKVRDAILEEYGDELSECANREDAESYIYAHMEDIKQTANSVLQNQGMDYEAYVYFDKEDYPRREYDTVALPAGEYMSLRVCLGNSGGQNWWCILFPPICMSSATAYEYEDTFIEAGFTPEEYRVIAGQSDRYVLKFRLLEILSDAADKISEKFSH